MILGNKKEEEKNTRDSLESTTVKENPCRTLRTNRAQTGSNRQQQQQCDVTATRLYFRRREFGSLAAGVSKTRLAPAVIQTRISTRAARDQRGQGQGGEKGSTNIRRFASHVPPRDAHRSRKPVSCRHCSLRVFTSNVSDCLCVPTIPLYPIVSLGSCCLGITDARREGRYPRIAFVAIDPKDTLSAAAFKSHRKPSLRPLVPYDRSRGRFF